MNYCDYYLNYFGFELLKGNCGQLESVLCQPAFFLSPQNLTGLEAGATYYVRMFSQNQPGMFNICMRQLPEPPANDQCENAVIIEPATGLACTQTYSGTLLGTTAQDTSVCQGFLPDVWYAFTATSDYHIIQLQNIVDLFSSYYSTYPNIEIMTGECGSMSSVQCLYSAIIPTRFATTPGETYYIRVVTPYIADAFTFDLCITTAPEPPTNPSCFTAMEIVANDDLNCTITYPGNTAGSIFSTISSCVSGFANWFHFTALTPVHILEILNYEQGFGTEGLFFELYAGATCDSLVYQNCQGIQSIVYLPLLNPGQQYYLRIVNPYSSGAIFDVCLKSVPPPTNDQCGSAISLPVYPDLQCIETVSGTSYAAGGGGDVFCTAGPTGDVWYQFTAEHTAHSITLQNIFSEPYGGSAYAHIEVFSGNCANLQQVACRPYRYNTTEVVGDLVPGQIYYVRIMGVNEAINFEICVSTPSTPPVNDACFNAIEIPVSPEPNCIDNIQGTTSNATISWSGVYDGFAGNDVWYHFIASSSTHLIQIENIVSQNYYGSFYGGTIHGVVYTGDCATQVSLFSFEHYYVGQSVLTNLVPGQDYLIRMYTNGDAASFDLCIKTPVTPPNDKCENAITLPTNEDYSCNTVLNGTTLGSSSSQVGCEQAGSTDVWYEFVATTSQVRLSYTHDNGSSYYGFNTGFEILSGNCDGLTSLSCYNDASYAVTQSGLIVGETYYVRVFSSANQYMNFSLCLISLPEPPVNDLCVNATSINVNSGNICEQTIIGTTLGAIQSQNDYCSGAPGHDVWYKFTAGNTGVIVDVSILSSYFGLGEYLSIGVYSGNCDNLQTITCNNTYSSLSFILQNLAQDSTYFIRLQSPLSSAEDFSLCLRSTPPAPVNISCNTALPVSPNTGLDCIEFVSGETTGVPEITYGSCYYPSRAVWYQFTATSPYHILNLANVYPTFGEASLRVEVYAGENCESSTVIACSGSDAEVHLPNLMTGSTYFVRIADNSIGAATFDLCIKTIAPPANDHCANATALPVSPDLTCVATTAGTTAGADITSDLNSCDPNVGQDVWYSFTATQSSHVVTLSNINNFDPQAYNYANSYLEIYSGSCGSLQLVRCFNNLYPYDQNNKTIGELEPGVTYYIRVGGYYTLINFDICITTPEPAPENDACAHATNLTVSAGPTCTETVFGTTQGATISNNLSNNSPVVNDIWYSFTATQQNHTLHINAFVSGYGYVSGIVYDGSCSNLNVVHYFNTYQQQDMPLTNLTVGATYYIRLFVEPYLPPASFLICVSSPAIPANDECAGAVNIPVNTGYTCEAVVTGTNEGATSSVSGCVSGPTTDVWYQFVATSADMRITFDDLVYTSSYHGIEIMEGNCGTLNSVVCVSSYPNFYNLTGLTVGQSYYVRVYAYANTLINFSLCLIEMPPTPTNDLCENAITLPVNPDMQCGEIVSGVTASLTGSSSAYCYYGPDMWYQFTATNATHVITLDNIVSLFGSEYIHIEVLNGDYCLYSSVPLLCSSQGSHILSGLTPGANYLVRIIGSAEAASSFDLCVRTLEPITNDECTNAIVLTPSEGQDCTNPLDFFTTGASLSSEPVSCYSGVNDVWFAFEATSFQHTIQLTGTNYSYHYVEVYQGNCGNLELIKCEQAYVFSQLQLNSLTPGTAYFIRIIQPSWINTTPGFYTICITTTSVDIESPYTINRNGACNPGSQAPVEAYIFNNTGVYIPAGQVSATLAVTGSNTGNHGPITNQYPIYPYSSSILVFDQVDLSNAGATTITSTISLLGDTNPANNTSSSTFDVLPLLTIYPDNDGDGYGNEAMPIESCDLYSGYTTTGGDCNDENVNVHPGATEICNGIDDDCDGSIDETTLALQLTAPVIPCGGSTTLLTALASGGSGSFQYSIDSMAFSSNNTWTQGPGTYLVRVQDTYGCFVSQNITIAPPNSVVISPVQVTHVACQGGNSGAINITVSGGSGVYTYHWSNSRTTQDIQNIAAGTYTVTVTDSQGCSAVVSAVVNPRLSVTTSATAVICNGGNTGTATALAVGGAPGYSYLWNNGGTTATISNLTFGTYRVTVTDALGCTRTSVIAVTQPQAINITGTTSIAPCAGQPGGGITISVFNAIAPATYLWSDGATTQNRTGIVAGTYTVTVTGANGCTKTKSFTVTSAASMVVTFAATQPTCGGTNGTLKANVTNGTQYPTNNLCNGARYCFQWSNGATTQTATGLAAGTYTVTVTDYVGCSTVAMGTVTQPAVLDITSVGTQQLTNGKYKLTVNATGGVPIYRYKRIPGSAVFQVSNIFNNVAPGTYKIVVQDNSNCTDTLQIVLPVFLSGPGSGDREEMTDEHPVTNLNLFPNPASNVVQLVADREFDQAEVRVYDMQGRFIYHQEFSGNTLTFEVGNWDSGLYILEISSGGERFMRKLSVVKE